jgi:hypothetical protein
MGPTTVRTVAQAGAKGFAMRMLRTSISVRQLFEKIIPGSPGVNGFSINNFTADPILAARLCRRIL